MHAAAFTLLGFYRWVDGRTYEGDWDKGYRHGIGIETMVSGEKYDGEFEKNKKHGAGNFRWPNGKTRDGQWANDQRVRWIGEEMFGRKTAKKKF